MRITKGGAFTGLVSNSGSASGIGGTPISGTPADGDTIVYDITTNTFVYTTGSGRWELAVIPGSPPDPLYADGDFLYIFVP